MVTDKLKVSFRKLKHIHHISDIQIRNLQRHKEYEQVFEGLYEEVRKNPKNAISYIGGDIAHSKTEMSPELVDQLSRLFKNLADICPLVIIAGNHDANLNNLNRMDVLTPIVENLNHPNLHYLKKTGVYTCADTDLIVWDVWDNEKDYIKAKDVPGDRKKVVLFHGTVDRSETDLGFKLPSKVKMKMFDGYDLGLLGDIHKRQFINKEETIAYCGSLVQQNHGEDVGKGYLLWDMETLKSKYIEIPNEYGYYTIDIDNGKLPELPKFPAKPRVRIRVSNTKPAELKRLMTKIQKMANIQESVITRVDGLSTEKIRDKKINIGDVTSVDYQFSLIQEYLNNNYMVDEDTMIKVKKVLEEVNQVIPEEHIQRNVNWKLKKFEFSNLFSYGEDNVVDFTKLNGIVGLFAPNASGKSALLDALSFCLFDISTRANRASDIINTAKTNLYCKLNFEIDGVDYFIERVGKKSPKRGTVKVDVNFYCIKNGVEHSLNGEERRDTNSQIRKYVGSYEDFILTAMSNQSSNSGFIEKSQREKKELLAQFLDMNVFEELYQIANEEIRELSALLKDYKNQNFTDKLVDAKKELKENNIVLESTKKRFEKYNDKRVKIRSEIYSLTSKLKSVDETIRDTDSLINKKEVLLKDISDKSSECTDYKMELKDISKDLENKKSKYSTYDLLELKSKHIQYETIVNRLSDLESEVKIVNYDLEHAKENLDGIGSLTFDDNCEHCVKNQNTPFAKKSKTLSDDIEKLKLKSNRLGEEIIDMKSEMFKYDVREVLVTVQELKTQSDDLTNQIEKLQLTNKSCNLELSELKSKLDSTENNINKSLEQKASVKHNTKIQQKIDKAKDSLDNLDVDISNLNDDVIDINGDIRISENVIQTVNDSIDKLEFMEQKYEGYEYYLQCVRRDGIPYELISEILPKLEVEINNILQPIVDFQILLNTDGKNINSYIAYGTEEYWPLELTSGMEKFISSVAIRTALVNVSNLPRPNFIAIDEGFGSLDTDNFNSLYLLFDYLKNQFDFIVTISHIDKTRDMVDQIIDITKLGGFSSIRYL